MNLYAFELGRVKDLCLAELITTLGDEHFIAREKDVAIFQLEDFPPQELQDKLGGTIKIIEIFAEFNHRDKKLKNNLLSALESELEQEFTNHKGKINFAAGILGTNKLHSISTKEILNFSKKFLKKLKINSRFVNKDLHKNPKPSTIYKAKVLEKGIDLSIIKVEKNIYIGKSISIQNIDAYSKRDFHKPSRDAKVGMLPPKLAQTMINLAGNCQSIYDPFCGTGTILIEGLLMGKESVVGSDISERMIEMTNNNLEWSKKEFKTKGKRHTFIRDAAFINKTLIGQDVDAIITEGYLGKPVRSLPEEGIREKTFRELANLHTNWLIAAHKSTPDHCKIVMCVAAFKTQKGMHHLPRFQEIIDLAGYKLDQMFTYSRKDQIVARDIAVLSKK